MAWCRVPRAQVRALLQRQWLDCTTSLLRRLLPAASVPCIDGDWALVALRVAPLVLVCLADTTIAYNVRTCGCMAGPWVTRAADVLQQTFKLDDGQVQPARPRPVSSASANLAPIIHTSFNLLTHSSQLSPPSPHRCR